MLCQVRGKVGSSLHHAAAGGAAGDIHVLDTFPPVGLSIVALHVTGGAVIFKASNYIELVLQHRDAKVAAWI